MVLRFFKEGMDAQFGETEHDAVHTDEAIIGGDGPITGVANSALADDGRIVGGDVTGLTNPLTEPLDADGYPIENIGAVNNIVHVANPSSAADINNAIASLPNTGGKVIIHQDADNTPLTITEAISDQGVVGVELCGTGRDSVRITADGSAEVNGIEVIGSDGWLIHSLSIDGNGTNVPDSADENNQCGIYVENSDNTRVTNTRVENTLNANIRARAANEEMVGLCIDNNITDTTIGSDARAYDNISVTGYESGEVGGSAMKRWALVNNQCLNCMWQAIEISRGTSQGMITNNYIVNADQQAINVHDSDTIAVIGNYAIDCTTTVQRAAIQMEADNSLASGNVVINSGYDGISSNQGGCAIVGNVVDGAEQTGIHARTPTTISANRIVGTPVAGIQVVSGGEGSTVIGNYVESTGNGIRAFADNTTVIGNSVSADASEILRLGGANQTAVGNRLSGAASNGVNANGTEGIISSNIVSDAGTAFVIDGDDMFLSGNLPTNSTTEYDDTGARTVINGWGTNAGDPSTEGEWAGNGIEGVNVYDETNDAKYVYVAGGWR